MKLVVFRRRGWTCFFFFFTLVTGPRRSVSLKLSDTRVYEPQIRARLGTPAHDCAVVVVELQPHPERDLLVGECLGYRGTSIIRNSPTLGPYSRR